MRQRKKSGTVTFFRHTSDNLPRWLWRKKVTVPDFAPALGPVAGGRRLAAVNVPRGFTLLGILIINTDFFA
jgi:hypothetical protein